MFFYYAGIILATIMGFYLLHLYQIKGLVWHLGVAVAIPLWGYITFLIAKKAYKAALEEKSIIHWFYNKVTKDHGPKFTRWGAIGLILVVGIPLPGTGSWTGSLLAFLFGISYWKALGLIFIGILIVGLAYVWKKDDLEWVKTSDLDALKE